MKYADVIIENKSKHTDALYTYQVPVCWDTGEPSRIGDRVRVPFGPYDKEKIGYIFRFIQSPSCPPQKVKTALGVDPSLPLTEEIMATVGWLKSRYAITYADGLRCFLPQGVPPRAGQEKTPYAEMEGIREEKPDLTSEQAAVLAPICQAIEAGTQACFLLHGVTASGKTEVYMRAIEAVLAQGRQAIMLVPEIALTGQIITRFSGRFGKERIAVLHSKLTRRERYDEWQRIRRGEASIVIGARMGVFAPLTNLGILIMDEEHEATYKADMTPKYETVDVALKRLKGHDGVLLLGSATPSVVSYQRCLEGIYQLLELKKRYNETPLPVMEIVDMRRELREGNTTIFSRALYSAVGETLEKGQQVILLQNRRGYANFLSCRTCGNVLRCPDCGISLTYHKQEGRMICHYCGRRYPVPQTCPSCGSRYMKFFGIGTEQVEEAVATFFPQATADRLDLDAIKRRRDMDRILERFSNGKTQILVGTQLVAKGLDFRNVGLVGVIAVDVTLNIPDYRSGERTFQLVTQVAGRAGRGREQGRVILQTYEPENYALVAAKHYDYQKFFGQEIRLRAMMEYPPFSDLLLVNFTSPAEETALGAAQRCRLYMENAVGPEDAKRIYAPHIAEFFKGEAYRYYILIKCPRGSRNRYIYYLDNFDHILLQEKAEVQMLVDVNPYGTI